MEAPASLLAVDLGLRCGLALFGGDGRLRWYRSHNFGSTARLRRVVPRLLRPEQEPAPSQLVLEGPSQLADIWRRPAERGGVEVRAISAEQWRQLLLYQRDQRHGKQAKRRAGELARAVIQWSEAPRATSLRHDAAEAILVGLWGVLELGWLQRLPPALRR